MNMQLHSKKYRIFLLWFQIDFGQVSQQRFNWNKISSDLVNGFTQNIHQANRTNHDDSVDWRIYGSTGLDELNEDCDPFEKNVVYVVYR